MVSPNIFDAIIFNLHPKVREFLDGLNQTGQIDHDENRVPHVISVDTPSASVHRCNFLRNGSQEHFLIHTRRKADPIRSWRDEDGWKRPVPVQEPQEDGGQRKERPRRTMEQVYESIVEQILPRRR